jgi:hypothetical protein
VNEVRGLEKEIIEKYALTDSGVAMLNHKQSKSIGEGLWSGQKATIKALNPLHIVSGGSRD